MFFGILGSCSPSVGRGWRRAVTFPRSTTSKSAKRQKTTLAVALNLGLAHSECRPESIRAVHTRDLPERIGGAFFDS